MPPSPPTEKAQKTRTGRTSLFKRKKNASQGESTASSQGQEDNAIAGVTGSPDRQRTKARYIAAAQALEDAVKGREKKWGALKFPALEGELENIDHSQFQDKINETLISLECPIKDGKSWKKCTQVLECVFRTLSPLAKNALTIAKEGQSIPILNPYGLLFGGLLIIITITEKELSRKKEFNNMLDFMNQQLESFKVIDSIPKDVAQRETLLNRALDVRSACMQFLAASICHDATSLGTTGKIFKTFILGDRNINDAMADLKSCVDNYYKAISNIHLSITNALVEKVTDALNLETQQPEHTLIDDTFIIPYQRNPQIKGRKDFLDMIKERLSLELPNKFNHRIALYGLGGVGKTQCALEYVYANKTNYLRIYWISAVNEASMLSGYQEIAKLVKLAIPQELSPAGIAKTVILWLKRQQSWLIVIDNLDDIRIAHNLLPETDQGKHILITTRNPRTRGIPAEPLEVPLLSPKDGVDLLSTLSNISVKPNSDDEKHAYEIVKELGYLPLAIDLAAAYVRDITGDFSEYLKQYHKNHERLLLWVPDGNRDYPDSVATAWSISFDIIQKNKHAVDLLRLFSFLNPDEILLEFVVAGRDALPIHLRDVLADEHDLSMAILELEKFSLIKWNRQNKAISIHRLVQLIVGDKISRDELISTLDTVISLCMKAFPEAITNETRPIFRKYQTQVVEPLLRIKTTQTNNTANIKERIANFLLLEGKWRDAEDLWQQSLQIRIALSGEDHPDTLRTMGMLAWTYGEQGRTTEAAILQKQVLNKAQAALGNDHANTLTAMQNLAWVYRKQGRTAEATKLREQVLNKSRVILGEEHPETLRALHNLASTYQDHGRTAEAAALNEEVLQKSRRILGDEHPDTLATMHNLAWTYQHHGRTAEAAALNEEVLQKRRRILGDEHPSTLATMHNLAWTYQHHGRTAEAAALNEEVLQKRRRILGDEHPDTLATMHNLAWTYQDHGRTAEAAALNEEAAHSGGRAPLYADDHAQPLIIVPRSGEGGRGGRATRRDAAEEEGTGS